MAISFKLVRIRVKGFNTNNGKYEHALIPGNLGDIQNCPEKCKRCEDLRLIKKSLKRGIFECHQLYRAIKERTEKEKEMEEGVSRNLLEQFGIDTESQNRFLQLRKRVE